MTNIRHTFALALAAALTFAGVGCHESGGVHDITNNTRTATKPHAPANPGMDSAERFGFRPTSPAAPSQPQAAAPAFQWKTPPGWQPLAPQPMRDLNFAAGDPPLIECFLTTFSSSGGGVAANVNRWRQQMGLAPDSADAIDALPAIEVLGFRGTLVELDGTYSGMRGDQQAEESKMFAAFVPVGDRAVTIKMIGPADQVEAERENFKMFVTSLAVAAPVETAHAHGHSEEADGGAVHEAIGDLAFEVSSDWKRTGDRPMRLVTYQLGDAGETECYISPLSGDGGGVNANLNRWLGQMGQAPLDANGLNALPTISVLGQDVSLLETGGTYTSMRGETKDDYALIGVFVIQDGTAYSIKLIGPKKDVTANRTAFTAFCESLHIH